ncbi:tripartite tricarboxylate transporter TctB family protein [Tepidicella baoligensis]|uniref:tripartite tricarboxylate transporter TctB family protein n=1 Tax=Tepidicella baoligensis TaxID=2707016 RepID=UPI0015D9779E|nr:tripartite tricarboxylate transporter TctB family protein [Tepidicella baoligensis]
MWSRDYRDIVGGLAMLAIGLFVAWHAYQEYDIGQLNRMGPGFFPVSLGILLAILGLLITIPALLRKGSPVKVEVKTLVLVTLSIGLFALLLKPLGIVFATIVTVLTSSLADRQISWKGRVAVALGVAAITWGVFIQGLSMVLPVWPWSP